MLRAFTILYSNKKLLNKYKKPIPKTWEELYNTTNYIVEEEKKLNHTSLLGFTGLFGGNNYFILFFFYLYVFFFF